MPRYGYTRTVTMLDGSSDNSSVRTSNALLVQDATSLTVRYSATTIAASVVSIDASWSEGFFSALTSAAAPNNDWLRYSSLSTNPGILMSGSNFTLGPRWFRFVRAATDSQASVIVDYRVGG